MPAAEDTERQRVRKVSCEVQCRHMQKHCDKMNNKDKSQARRTCEVGSVDTEGLVEIPGHNNYQ